MNKIAIAKSLLREKFSKSRLWSVSPEIKSEQKQERAKKWDKLAYKRSLQTKYPSDASYAFGGPEHEASRKKYGDKAKKNTQRANKLDSMAKSLIREAIYDELGIEKGWKKTAATLALAGTLGFTGGAKLAQHDNATGQTPHTHIEQIKDYIRPAVNKVREVAHKAKPILHKIAENTLKARDQVLTDPKKQKEQEWKNPQFQDKVLNSMRARGIKTTGDIKNEIKKRGMTVPQVEKKLQNMGIDSEYVKNKIKEKL